MPPEYKCGYRAGALSDRDLAMLSMAALGMSNNEIAGQYNIAPSTVSGCFDRILPTLDARTRAHAVFKALRMGWLDRDTAEPRPRVVVLVPEGHPAPVIVYFSTEDGDGDG